MTNSRIPKFFSLLLNERRRLAAERSGLSIQTIVQALDNGGLTVATADKVVENVLGIYALPFGVTLNLTINGTDRLAPMVTEEPSVVAAASNAAKMIRAGGGFKTEMSEELMTTQIQLFDVPDPKEAKFAIKASKVELLRIGSEAVPDLLRFGGGPRDLEVRDLGNGIVVVHVYVDCVDAMGANIANTIAEAMGHKVAELSRGKLGLRILTNLADRRVVRVSCRVQECDLAVSSHGDITSPSGIDVATAIEQASRFAEVDPYRAVTHNKGIMNGIDAVVLATGNDWRAVEAGAHAYAARTGVYRPLATWRREGSKLCGLLEMPLALGTIGGTLRAQPAARLALELAGVKRSRDLIELAACVGMASNLAALRALSTEGIQRGHMSLHARSVAVMAGASGDEVERIATVMFRAKQITVEVAQAELERIRGGCRP